jgi:hypothetical protein
MIATSNKIAMAYYRLSIKRQDTSIASQRMEA